MPAISTGSARLELWAGTDRYRKRERLQALSDELSVHMLDRHDLDASQVSGTELLGLLRALPVASPLRLVVLDEAQRLDAALLKLLAEHASTLPLIARLILLADIEGEASHPLMKALGPVATVVLFPRLPPADVHRWLQESLARVGKRIQPMAAREVVAAHGSDLAGLHSWLDQALAWLGHRDELTVDDVRELLPGRRGGADPPDAAAVGKGGFVLTEAIARRDVSAALRTAHEQCEAGKDVLELLGLVIWRLQRWLAVAQLTKARTAPDRIALLTGLQAWQVDRVRREVAGWSIGSLRRFLARCAELDVAVKTGRVVPRVGLELLIVAGCLSRE